MRLLTIILVCCCMVAHSVYAQERVDYSTPEATFRTYMRTCQALDFTRSDACYTQEFRDFIATNKEYQAHRHVGQLRNVYKDLHGRRYEMEQYGTRVIMRFGPEYKRPAPLYFVKERGEWKIDGMFAFNNIIMEDREAWHWRNGRRDNEKRWLRSR